MTNFTCTRPSHTITSSSLMTAQAQTLIRSTAHSRSNCRCWRRLLSGAGRTGPPRVLAASSPCHRETFSVDMLISSPYKVRMLLAILGPDSCQQTELTHTESMPRYFEENGREFSWFAGGCQGWLVLLHKGHVSIHPDTSCTYQLPELSSMDRGPDYPAV